MQQHTGQHILSAALERVLDAPTLSSHLGEERSSLEVGLADVGWEHIARVEDAANQVVWSDLPIMRHWVTNQELGRFQLRKPPQVSGRIRIVEIPTGISPRAAERTRIARARSAGSRSCAGRKCAAMFGSSSFAVAGAEGPRVRTEALVEAARRRTLKDRELIAHLERALSERDELQKRVTELSERLIVAEAKERVGEPPKPVSHFAPVRPRDELRRFALKCLEAGAPWSRWARRVLIPRSSWADRRVPPEICGRWCRACSSAREARAAAAPISCRRLRTTRLRPRRLALGRGRARTLDA
jgi:alanyl-tRNA synthetase